MNAKIIEAMKALRANSIAYARNDAGQVYRFITKEFDYIYQIKEVEGLVSKLAQFSGKNLFTVKKARHFNRNFIQPTKLGKQFLDFLNFDFIEMQNHFPSHQFNPHFDIFKRHAQARNLMGVLPFLHLLDEREANIWCDVLNGCAKCIGDEAGGASFKKEVNAFHHAANKNYRELREYFSELIKLYPHSLLEVSRFDLAYAKDKLWPSVQLNISLEGAKENFGLLLKLLKKDLPAGCLVGYAWRMASSLNNSINFHVVTFTDKSKMVQEVDLEQLLANLWMKITDGRGIAFNCKNLRNSGNGAYEEYKCCGIGSSNDPLVREEINQVAFYMTQSDFHIRFVAPGKGRTFGKGVLPK